MLNYQEYLKSFHWQETKERKLKAEKSKCQVCSSREYLQVHHLHYNSLYCEKNSDLLVLCETCHIKETEYPFAVELLQKRQYDGENHVI